MRVTAAMVRSRILHNMSSTLDVLQVTQTQLATGKRIEGRGRSTGGG